MMIGLAALFATAFAALFVFELVSMLVRNILHHIDDHPDAWDDSRWIAFEKFSNIFGFGPWAIYCISSFFAALITLMVSTHDGDISDKVYSLLNFLSYTYVFIVVAMLGGSIAINHLRRLRRIEKGLTESGGVVISEQTKQIVDALGGMDNISNAEACLTRIRLVLNDLSRVDETALKKAGCAGVVLLGERRAHLIYGIKSEAIVKEIELMQ